MIVVFHCPGRKLRIDALKIHRRPVDQRAKFLSMVDSQIVCEALQAGLSRPEAYAHADSYISAVRERVEFLDAALGHPGATVHHLPTRNIYKRRKEIA